MNALTIAQEAEGDKDERTGSGDSRDSDLCVCRLGESTCSGGNGCHWAHSDDIAIGGESMKGVVGSTTTPSELVYGIATLERFGIETSFCLAATALLRSCGGGASGCSHPCHPTRHVHVCSCVYSFIICFIICTCVHCHAPTHVQQEQSDVALARWLKH